MVYHPIQPSIRKVLTLVEVMVMVRFARYSNCTFPFETVVTLQNLVRQRISALCDLTQSFILEHDQLHRRSSAGLQLQVAIDRWTIHLKLYYERVPMLLSFGIIVYSTDQFKLLASLISRSDSCSMEEAGEAATTTNLLELPEDVVENIIGRLALPALTQIGIVCKQWQRISRSIVDSRQSASFCLVAFPVGMTAGTRETNYWPTGQIRLAMFDPFARSWLKVKHPFPPIGAYPFQPQRRRIDWDLFLVPSTGGYSGLVCFVIPSHAPSTVFHYWIGNPITGKWENIPGPRKQTSYREVAHQLVVCPRTKSFKIFNFAIQESGVHEWNCCVQVYDSGLKKWRSGRQLLNIPKFSSIRVGTASATVVYLMLFMKYNQVCVPLAAGQTQCFPYYRVFRIVSLDIQDEQWLSVTPESSFEFLGDYGQHATWDYCPQLIIKPGTEHLSCSSPSSLQLVAGTFEPCSFEPCYEHCQECAGQQLAGKICIAEYEPESTTWKIKKELESDVYLADCSENLIVNSCYEARAGFIYCAHMRGSWKYPFFYSPGRPKHHLSDDSWTHLPPPGFGVPENNWLRRFTLCRFSPRLDI